MQPRKFEEITDQMIQDWKAKHGDRLEVLTVRNAEKKEFNFVIIPPSRTVMDAVAQHGIDKNVTKSNQALINNCVLGGDLDEMEKDGKLYAEVLQKLNKTTEKYESEIKKL